MKALQGVRVLDLTHALAGPFCTYQLGLLGAEIVKIEKPDGGDDFRDFARPPDWAASPSFVAVNAGKRSVAVNMKTPDGAKIIRQLAGCADVVVENLRPGVADRLGVGWADLSRINPKLIYCAISGFGQSGAMSRWPAYDHTIQAMAGMSWTGAAEDAPSQGRGFSVDCFSGYVAFAAILGALFRRERLGEGQYLDVAMLDAAFVLMGVGIARQMMTGDVHNPLQPIVHERPTVGPFRAKSGWLWLSVNFDRQFAALCNALGATDLAGDDRFATAAARAANAEALREELAERIAPHDAGALEKALMQADAPAAQVRIVSEALALPAMTERDLLQSAMTPDGRAVQVINAGFCANEGAPGLTGGVAALGADTEAVLAALGYDSAGIDQLRRCGAI